MIIIMINLLKPFVEPERQERVVEREESPPAIDPRAVREALKVLTSTIDIDDEDVIKALQTIKVQGSPDH